MEKQVDFTKEKEFTDQILQNLDLRLQVIEGCSFDACTFKQGNFNGAALKNCRFVDCTFEHCDMSNVQLTSSTLRSVKFQNSKLVGINWTAASEVMHLGWYECILNYGNFSGLDLRKCVVFQCSAIEADFIQTNFSEANLCGTDFALARFASTILIKADFRQAKNYSIRPDSNKIKNAKFSLPEATLLLYGLDIVLEN
ncbi:MAG: pentapeptide repeat-containing protein [Bdellovibrionota bacterium]